MKKILRIVLVFFILFQNMAFCQNIVNNNSIFKTNVISAKAPSKEELSKIKVPILMYHDIRDNYTGKNGAIVDSKKFKEDMNAIKKAGYNPIFYTELVDYVSGFSTLPQNPIIINFDDGYESNYLIGFPIFKELKIKVNIALIGCSINNFDKKPASLKNEEIQEMYKSGLVEFQLHSYNMHYNDSEHERKGVLELKSETYDKYVQTLAKDVYKLQRRIKSLVGYRPKVFVYPYGLSSKYSERALKYIGIKATVTTAKGANNLENGLYGLKRINREPYYTTETFMNKIKTATK